MRLRRVLQKEHGMREVAVTAVQTCDSSRRRHTRCSRDWSSDVCSSDLVLRDDHSASLASVQRFRGKLGGRPGTFVLQGQEVVENGKIKAAWFVVPGSGTGELRGLRGERS